MAKFGKNAEGFSKDVETYWTIIEEIFHYLMKLVKNVEMVCFEEKVKNRPFHISTRMD